MFDYFWGVLFKITLVLIFLFIYKVPSWYKVGVCTSTLGRIRGIKHDLNTVKKYSYKNWPYQNISDPIKVFNLELITAHDHAVLQCRGHIGGGYGSRS